MLLRSNVERIEKNVVALKHESRRVEEQQKAGALQVLMSSQVASIQTRSVLLSLENGREQELPNDAVIVCAGGELPTPLLQKIGIRFETKFGTR